MVRSANTSSDKESIDSGEDENKFEKSLSLEDEEALAASENSENSENNSDRKIVISNSCWALALSPESDIYGELRKEEKIYEDLCYVTFSSSAVEVVISI